MSTKCLNFPTVSSLSSDDIVDITYSNLCGQSDPCYHQITIKLKDGTQIDGEGANATQLGYVLCYIGKRNADPHYHFDYVFTNEFYHGGLLPHKGPWPWSKNYVYLGRFKILLGQKRGEIPPLMAPREKKRRWCFP